MNKGFTLIELLVVVLIIGILSAIALPQYTTAVEKARSAEAISLMGSMRYAAERGYLQSSKWPAIDEMDIEIPSVSSGTGSTATTSYRTKNFNISVTGAGATGDYVINFVRANDGTAVSGDSAYTLKTTVKTDGTAVRECTGSTTLCKAITSGKSYTGCSNCTAGF